MRNKLLLALGLLMAFSAASYAQPATHTVEVQLQEVRTVTLGGVGSPIIAVKRSPAASPIEYLNASASIAFVHDLALTQKIVAEASNLTGEWLGRGLSVTATATAAPWNAVGVGINKVAIITGGISNGPRDFITGLVAGTGGAMDLGYLATADQAVAVVGNGQAQISYTLTDQ